MQALSLFPISSHKQILAVTDTDSEGKPLCHYIPHINTKLQIASTNPVIYPVLLID